MSKWREVRLGEVSAGTQYGYTESATHINTGVQFLRITDIVDYFIDWKSVPYCNITQKNLEKYCIKKNDLLIARTGATAGRFKTITASSIPSAVFASYLIRFKINEDQINPVFLNYYLQTTAYKGFVENYIGGSAQPNINAKTLSRFKLWIPDLTTQEKIADILSTYDKLIENNNRRIEILEKTAEEIYKEWFVRMRFPGHGNTKFIKGIPEGWEVKRVGDLAKFKRGKNLVIRDAIPGEVPVIAGGMTPSCYHNESNTDAPVITVSASGANAGYTQLNHIDVWASDCSYIDINDTELIYYIYLLLKVSHKEILNLQLGSAQPHVYARDLNKFKFLKPEMRLIKIINNYAKDIFEEIKYLSSINQNLIKQRDLLLPRLMNGTIEVK